MKATFCRSLTAPFPTLPSCAPCSKCFLLLFFSPNVLRKKSESMPWLMTKYKQIHIPSVPFCLSPSPRHPHPHPLKVPRLTTRQSGTARAALGTVPGTPIGGSHRAWHDPLVCHFTLSASTKQVEQTSPTVITGFCTHRPMKGNC